MTIHADWISQFKDWAPNAFNAASDPAFAPGQEIVGFIDGQIKLMGMPRVVPEAPPLLASPPSGAPNPCDQEEEDLRGTPSAFLPFPVSKANTMMMPPPSTPTTTWSTFLEAQFAHPIQRLWRLGARRVVLAFDDYENVPKGKAITQASRRARHTGPPFVFHAEDPLPPFPPTGEDWTKAMSNRAFKARVQQLVMEALPVLLTPPIAFPTTTSSSLSDPHPGHAEGHDAGDGERPEDEPAPQPDVSPRAPGADDGADGREAEQARGPAQEGPCPPHVAPVQEVPGLAVQGPLLVVRPFQVIVDWRGPALVEFTWNGADGVFERAESHRPRAQVGEADIKFAHWTRAVNSTEVVGESGGGAATLYGDAPAHDVLIDNDDGGRDDGLVPAPAMPNPRQPVAMAVLATDGDFLPIALLLPEHIPIHILRIEKRMDPPHVAAAAAANQSRPHHGMEWVDVRGLRAELLKRNVITVMGTPARDPHLPGISPLIVLIALTGTDYSRNLPSIGPKTILKKHGLTSALRLARSALVMGPDAPLHLLDVDAAAHSLVASLYASTYHQHTLGGGVHRNNTNTAPTCRFNSLLGLLTRNTRLSEKTRARLPSLAQVQTTLRNANFLLQYWRGLLVGADSSIDPRHGFRENPATGAVEWDDGPAGAA